MERNAPKEIKTFSHNQLFRHIKAKILFPISKNFRQGLRANGFSLLPLALRPGLVVISLLGILLLQNSYVSEVSAASMTLTLPSAITLNASPNGSLAKSSASTFSAKTDGTWGYSLNIKAKSTTDMTNGSAKLAAISKNMTEAEYNAAGNNNTWGFIPSILNSTTNTSFIAASTSDKLIDKTSAANASAVKDYSITLGAKVDSTAITGTYSNTMVLTLTANTADYSITYNLNSGSWSGKSPETGSTTASTVNISSVIPSRTSYEFKGWCSVSTTNDSCSGKTYQPNDHYTLSASGNNLILWAMWKSNQPTTMQEMTSAYCNTMSEHQIITLKDSRDNNNYKIAKLKDGKCWMIENLRLVGQKTLTSSDSDVSSSYSLPASDNTDWVGSDNTSHVHLSTVNTSSYGAYYNWYTATAGTGIGFGTPGFLGSGVEAASSICPKGWRLPIGGEDSDPTNEFHSLYTYYNSFSAMQVTPVPNFIISGCYFDSEALQDQLAYYWSSTYSSLGSGDYDQAYGLELNKTFSPTLFVYSDSPIYTYTGGSVRCVAR